MKEGREAQRQREEQTNGYGDCNKGYRSRLYWQKATENQCLISDQSKWSHSCWEGNHLMGRTNAQPQLQSWLGQTSPKRCSCQDDFWGKRVVHIVSDTLFTKWKVNLNCISTGSPCGKDGSFIIAWSTSCPPHDQSPLSVHKSHFMPASLLKRQNKSLISTAAALGHCANNHREIGGTEQSKTLQQPRVLSTALCSFKQYGLLRCGNLWLLLPKSKQWHLHYLAGRCWKKVKRSMNQKLMLF